jgi:helicase
MAAIKDWLAVSDQYSIRSIWQATAHRVASWRQSGELRWYEAANPLLGSDTVGVVSIGSKPVPWPAPGVGPATRWDVLRGLREKMEFNAAYLGDVLRRELGEPLLFVCATKAQTRAMARVLASRLEERASLPRYSALLVDYIAANEPHLSGLAIAVQRGVAYHNSALPSALRRILEQAIEARELVAVAATTTLAEGVDFPFRCVIVVDWPTWGRQDEQPMSLALFRNVVGRCGRANVFTEGDAVLIDNPVGDPRMVTTPAMREVMHEALVTGAGYSEVRSALGSGVGEEEGAGIFGAQLLAAIGENPPVDNIIQLFAESSLAARGGSLTPARVLAIADPLTVGGEEAFARAASPLQLTGLGHAANRSGLSPRTCREVLAWLRELTLISDLPSAGASLLERLGVVPEQQNALFKNLVLGKGRTDVKLADLAGLITDWADGTPLLEMFVGLRTVQRSHAEVSVYSWAAGVLDSPTWEDRFEKFVEMMQQVIGEFLPWVFQACQAFSGFAGPSGGMISWGDWAERLNRSAELPDTVE